MKLFLHNECIFILILVIWQIIYSATQCSNYGLIIKETKTTDYYGFPDCQKIQIRTESFNFIKPTDLPCSLFGENPEKFLEIKWSVKTPIHCHWQFPFKNNTLYQDIYMCIYYPRTLLTTNYKVQINQTGQISVYDVNIQQLPHLPKFAKYQDPIRNEIIEITPHNPESYRKMALYKRLSYCGQSYYDRHCICVMFVSFILFLTSYMESSNYKSFWKLMGLLIIILQSNLTRQKWFSLYLIFISPLILFYNN